MQDSLKAKVKNVPNEPGVYLFKSEINTVIYVGKAKLLAKRVGSYFQKNIKVGTKTQALISRIADIEYIVTSTELEALLLEAELIKKYRPKYNIVLKDDKSYLYIVIRSERLGEGVNLPVVLSARKTDLEKGDIIFGPYPDGGTVKFMLNTIRKVFPYRDCSKSKFNKYKKSKKPCLFGHIGLCQAPCIEIGKYKLDIKKFKRFMEGKGSKVVREYKRKMQDASKNQDYESALYYRNILQKYKYLISSKISAERYIENPNLVDDLAKESLEELKTNLPILHSEPNRIECYDISSLSGKEAVGSMVVAIDGKLDKSEYRRFKIKLKNKPDDVHMMQEVLNRRIKREFSKLKSIKKWGVPDLIVLDGGKGQVSTIAKVLSAHNIGIPLIGIAKRNEKLVFLYKNNFQILELPIDNEGLKLLIRLRDEAHRFAQSYHHHLRLKKIRV